MHFFGHNGEPMKAIYLFTLLVSSFAMPSSGAEPSPSTNLFAKRFPDGSSLHLNLGVVRSEALIPPKVSNRPLQANVVPIEGFQEFLLVLRKVDPELPREVPIWAYRIPKLDESGYLGELKMIDAVRDADRIVILFNNGKLICEFCSSRPIDRSSFGPFVPRDNVRHVIYREFEALGHVVQNAQIKSVGREVVVEFEVSGKGRFRARIRDDKVTVESLPAAK